MRYKQGDAWKWLNDTRAVPATVALFVRDAVEIAVLQRRLSKACAEISEARRAQRHAQAGFARIKAASPQKGSPQ